MAFLPENHALAIAIMSYNGRLDFGLLGDYDAMPDIEDLGSLHRGRRGGAARGGAPPGQARAHHPGR